MNLLILGDVMGASGRKAISNKLPDLIKKFESKHTNPPNTDAWLAS